MKNLQYEINWVEGIEQDFLNARLTEIDILKIKSKLDSISDNPTTRSERVKGVPTSYLRKLKFGNYRLFIYIDDKGMNIYCLAFLPRKDCYNKISLNKVLTLVKEICE